MANAETAHKDSWKVSGISRKFPSYRNSPFVSIESYRNGLKMGLNRGGLTGIFLLCFSAAVLFQNCNGANLLGLFPSCSPSHLIVHMSEMIALAEKGHNITVITTLEPKVNHKSIRVIVVPPEPEKYKVYQELMDQMAKQKNSMWTMMRSMLGSMNVMFTMQFDVLNDPRAKEIYNSPNEKFDAVISGYFMNNFALAIPAKLNIPVIISWSGPPMTFLDNLIGNPLELAYVPNPQMETKRGEVLNFKKRLQNFMMHQFFHLFASYLNRLDRSMYNDLIKDSSTPLRSYEEMQKNISLVFVNHHFSEGPIRPYVPALVEIGGIQIKDKPNPLPKDVANFLNGSKKNGAILLSLGSNIKSDHVPPASVAAIYKSLSALKQNVIWKWDDLQNTPGNASNILYKKWLPQDDILAHRNIKLFITHAGKGGLAEAQYHGVPMIALPIFGDQMGNAANMASSGYGIAMDILTITSASLTESITEVLETPAYSNNVKSFSKLYRDRPLTAKENVVFWTEYILRHHGAPHMQSPLLHLNIFQSSSLDVICFLIAVLYIVWRILKLTVVFIVKRIKCKLCGKAKSNKKIKKN